jgi:hypothetical protein
MRVVADSELLEVEPGSSTSVVVEVVNTGSVIDGVSARVLGISEYFVKADPQLLPLFPEASGQVTLNLDVPPSHPAGRHHLTVEVTSHGTTEPSSFIDLDMDVAARPDFDMAASPRVVRARRGAKFMVEVTNRGNVPLDVELRGADPDRIAKITFTPPRRRIDAGLTVAMIMNVRGPRTFTGPEADRTVLIEASALPVGTPSALQAPPAAPVIPDGSTEILPRLPQENAPIADPDAELAQEVPDGALVTQRSVMLRQRPFIGRGLLTALILLSIIALWAAIFLLGLGKVLSGDPMTKEAPASFFAALAGKNGTGNGTGSNSAPAGALPKSGELPAGQGSQITGKVIAATTGQPVGHILVQAYRSSPTGLLKASSAATQADGTYTLAGLFPTSYYLQFSSPGFRTDLYPQARTIGGASKIVAAAQGTTSNINVTIAGNPATISGTVSAGDTTGPFVTTVTARPLVGGQSGKPAAVTTTNAAGGYSLKNLPAPDSYELTFTTPGYLASTLVDTVNGGDNRLEPTTVLGASLGQISGIVHDGSTALGGATIATTVGGKPVTVVTPTTGQIGAFTLPNLPTPATYVITVSSLGHGSSTSIVDLAAGQSRAGLSIDLASGTGTVSGIVVDAANHGLGGVTVTVGGATGTPTATTLTAGSPGTFTINGLAVPGTYTLTATLDGYAPQSVPVVFNSVGVASSVRIPLTTQLGSITGEITKTGDVPLAGATIVATNGQQVFHSMSATSNGPTGGTYLISNLQPGSYSVTVTAGGFLQETALVTVTAGTQTTQNVNLPTSS